MVDGSASGERDALRTDVVVVGGGIAGLTCALGLLESGLDVILLERSARLGGRASSWIDPGTGDPVHIGPHVFVSDYPNMLKLLRRLGTSDRIVWHGDEFITMVEGQRMVRIRMCGLPAPLHFAPSWNADAAMGPRDFLSNVPVSLAALQLDESDVLRLDGVNASAFLRSMGVSERSIRRFWRFACMSIMNVPLELCSAGALMRFYRDMIGHNGYRFGFPDGGLGDVFAPRSQELLEAGGVRLLMQTGVRGFTGDAGRATGVELEDGRRIEARFVVSALPPSALRLVARREWLDAHRTFQELVHFQPCPYVSTQIWFDRKLTDLRFWARAHGDNGDNDLNCDFYDLSNINTGWSGRPSVIASNAIYSHRAEGMSDDEVVARTVVELAEFLPEAARAGVRHAVVNRIPMAIHCPFPGMERRRPDTRTPVRGLLLAGDWVRTGMPSCMESAARSGWLAAEAVLEGVGRPRKLAEALRDGDGLARVARRLRRFLPLDPLPRHVRRMVA